MEVFEVHITGDSRIIEMASYLNLKTIQVDLFRPILEPFPEIGRTAPNPLGQSGAT